MKENSKISIVSCVGQRPLAIISPINSLIQHEQLDLEKITLILFTTDKTETIAEECKKWFEEELREIKIIIKPFSQNILKELVKNSIGDSKIIYFNTNPGMNWEIATLTLDLPNNTNCIYADFTKLYLWKIDEDITNAKTYNLFDLGLDLYNRFSEKKFYKVEGINQGLSENTKNFMIKNGYNYRFIVKGKNIPESGPLADFINDHIVWVKEKCGYAYLLFDFQTDQSKNVTDIDEIKKLNKYYLNNYRAITELFDELNFSLAIITNDLFINKRAELDGVISYFFHNKNKDKFEILIGRWFESDTKIKPKKVLPYEFKDKFDPNVHQDVEVKSGLFVCLGDNIEPTLKAIHSSDIQDVIMFYDNNSPRISLMANNIRKIVRTSKIHLLSTDNKGSKILENIKMLSTKMEKVEINTTPGTKSQTIALVQAARMINKIDSLVSIDKNCIKKLIDPSYCREVKNPDPEEVIKCLLAPYKGSSIVPEIPPFLSVMEGLAEGTIEIFNQHNGALNFSYKTGKPIFEDISKNSYKDFILLKCNIDGKTYRLLNSFSDSRQQGLWWEAVVAYVLKKKLTKDILWQVMWDRPLSKLSNNKNKKVHFTEIDIAFRWEDFICAVSCKAGLTSGLNEITRYEIKSESSKRFGRFALPFVAVPAGQSYFNINNLKTDFEKLIIEGVMYLIPSLMINKEVLTEAIRYFVQSKRTTSANTQ